MTTECQRIANELAATVNGEAWYGDSLREILQGVTAEQARAHPIPDAHSIWEIVLHLDAWVKFFGAATRGTPIPPWPSMPTEQDWPSIGVGDQKWESCVRSLFENHMELVTAIESFGDERLATTVPGRTYNFERMFRSASLHAAYHGGQIALLRRMLR